MKRERESEKREKIERETCEERERFEKRESSRFKEPEIKMKRDRDEER